MKIALISDYPLFGETDIKINQIISEKINKKECFLILLPVREKNFNNKTLIRY